MPYIPPPDYSTFPKLARDKTFAKSARRAIELKAEIDERQLELKELQDDVIEPSLRAGGVALNTSVIFDGVPIAVRDVSSGFRLVEDLLVQAGVKRSVIDKCKVENKRKHYVQIGQSKEDADAAKAEKAAAKKAKKASKS